MKTLRMLRTMRMWRPTKRYVVEVKRMDGLGAWIPSDVQADGESIALGLIETPRYTDDMVSMNLNGKRAVLRWHQPCGVLQPKPATYTGVL